MKDWANTRFPVSELHRLQASELADLEDEANMPLEQLLARYTGYTDNPQAASPSHTSSSTPLTDAQSHVLTDPLPTETADNTHSRGIDPTQSGRQAGSLQLDSTDKGKRVAALPERPASASIGVSGGTPSASIGVTTTGGIEGMAQVSPEQQAEQATAAGMDAFEHSQALAERRASGSQAGPSALSPPASGKGVHIARHCCDSRRHKHAHLCLQSSSCPQFTVTDSPWAAFMYTGSNHAAQQLTCF